MNMNPKKWMLLCIVLLTFALYAIVTGGLVVSNVDDFGGQRTILLADGLESDVSLVPVSRHLGVPFICHYYSAGKPFGLRLQIWDKSKKYRSIEITEVRIEYENGEVVKNTEPWLRELKHYTEYHSSSSGRSQTEIFMLSDQIPQLVLRHIDAKITLTGQLIKADGKKVSFKALETFKAESRTQVTTYWQEISSC